MPIARLRSHRFEDHFLGVCSSEAREVCFHKHVRKGLAQHFGGTSQVGNLPFSKVECHGSDLTRLVPGAILMGDGYDSASSMRFDESFKSAAEEIEILRDKIEQTHGLNPARHSQKIRPRARPEVDSGKLLKVVIPAAVYARDDGRARPLGIPG